MRHLARLICAICGVLGVAMQARAADPVRAAFDAPLTLARPMLRWWWPGDDVTDAELRREIAQAAAIGFGGLEIQPFRAGLITATGSAASRIDSYATAEFFGHVAQAARAGAALGVPIDMTFGSGWPTGGAAITPEHGMLELRAAAATLNGPAHLHAPVPLPPPPAPNPIDALIPAPADQALPAAYQARLRARGRLIAVLAVRGTAPVLRARPGAPGMFGAPPPDVAQSGALQPGSTIDLTRQVAADGTLDWDVPPGQWQLIAFSEDASGEPVKLAAGSSPQLVLNHFDAAAFAAHARAVGDAGLPIIGAAIGHGLRSVFVDSFELTPENYWCADFLAEFRRRRSYDLTPYLPLILLPDWMNPYQRQASRPLYGMGDTGARVLEDYHRTVSELMQERFFAPLRDWSHQHGFSLRLQAHGAPVDLVQTYGMADIPETEDLYNGPQPDFLSYARSAADIYGRTLVSAESFIIDGHALDTTPTMLKARADRLFIGGVTRVVGHGMAYAALPDAGLGWTPFATFVGNQFNPRNPLFDLLGPWVAYVTRLQAVLQATRPVVPVALYRDAVFAQSLIDLRGAHEGALFAALRANAYTADTLTRDGLLRSHAEGGAVVTPGGMRYAAVVIEDQPALDRDAADRLAAFARAGVRIVFAGQVPSRAQGLVGAVEDAAVREDVASMTGPNPVAAAPDVIAARLRAANVAPSLSFTSADRPDVIEHTDGVRHFLLIANPGDRAMQISFTVPYSGSVEAWHPWTGLVTSVPATRVASGISITTALGAFGSTLLVIDPRGLTSSVPTYERSTTPILDLGGAGWSLRADGFDNTSAAVHRLIANAAPGDWRDVPGLAAFSGRGVYTTRFVLSRPVVGRALIDLGTVADAARVSVNGCSAIVVMAPYAVDVTQALHPGANTLLITVADPPRNGEAGRTLGGFAPGPPPVQAGLIGPVRLLGQTGTRDADRQAVDCRPPLPISQMKPTHH